MKPISRDEYNKVIELCGKLDSHIDNGLLKMIEDEEEVNLDFQANRTHYKTLYRSEDELIVTSEYTDEDGEVYENEDNLLELPLQEKLMIYKRIVKFS
jgi:hypothetical protein